nr:protein FLC EXPRESSOR-like [Ipomoea trifida]
MRLPYTVDIRICEMRISAAMVGRRRLASAPQFANADLGRAGRRAGDSRVVRNSQMRISPSPVGRRRLASGPQFRNADLGRASRPPTTRVWSAIRKCEFQHLSFTAFVVKAEANSQVTEVYEKSLIMEVDISVADKLRTQWTQVTADVEKLTAHRREITTQMKAIGDELLRLLSKVK